MNEKTVGMENLPNVFIEKIFAKQSSAGKFIDVKLVMYDHSPNRSWRRPEMSDLRVKVAFVNKETSDQLKEGSLSLYDITEGFNLATIAPGIEFEIEEEMDGFTKFSKIVEASFTSVATGLYATNIDVYAACYVDFGTDKFNIDLFDKYYGPLSGEKILVGGEFNKQSGYFYSPIDNEEYAGPVHQHPNKEERYMEGSQHVDEPHMSVRYVLEENNKITIYDFEDSDTGNNGGGGGSSQGGVDFDPDPIPGGNEEDQSPDSGSDPVPDSGTNTPSVESDMGGYQ